jgi:hypothetical protein
MTTYIAMTHEGDGRGQLVARPYCSAEHVPFFASFLSIESYEFDETCSTCGELVRGTAPHYVVTPVKSYQAECSCGWTGRLIEVQDGDEITAADVADDETIRHDGLMNARDGLDGIEHETWVKVNREPSAFARALLGQDEELWELRSS